MPSSNPFNNTISFPLSPSISQPRLLRFSSNNSGDDSFEFFPWSDSDSEIQWLPEDRVTLFTTDGLFQIEGKMVPRRVRSSDVRAMQLIDELEVAMQGPYSRRFGYISFSGDMDIALAMRTIVFPTGTRYDTMYSYKDLNSASGLRTFKLVLV
ncbi:uncharacterized protein [Cicer arietinum]|uniref:Uncharacterized protein LOC113784933 n=1 Tax=Cicer arietinum TaxID=3827 RepID=A0A3Q7YC08_CICAR|nr:uncharacterized protein LOC113784933 [Cicer arietinum]